MELIYNTNHSGSSFHRLSYAIKGYNAPLLILIKN